MGERLELNVKKSAVLKERNILIFQGKTGCALTCIHWLSEGALEREEKLEKRT